MAKNKYGNSPINAILELEKTGIFWITVTRDQIGMYSIKD